MGLLMANTTISPNMGMPIPVVGQDPGPDWATNIDSSLFIVDSHNHSAGQGVPITPDGLNISTDLPMNGNNLLTTRSVRFLPQNSPLANADDLGCIYESGVDLYYNDGSGNQIRITQSGAVTGATGTITGLPSGTASASFAGGTFTFDSATNTPATMAVGPLIIGRQVANPKTVTITPNAAQPSNYGLTLPIALPATSGLLQSDSTGGLSFLINQTGTTTTTFTANNGGGTSSSVILSYQRIGDWITCFSPAVTAIAGTGTTALIANTGLPSWASPATASAFARGPTDIISNAISTTSPGLVTISTSGIVIIQRDNVVTPFGNGSSAGCDEVFSFTYYVGTGS